MKFIRSSLVVAVTALVAAACGDKVTVPAAVTTTTITTTAAPKVNSVTVTPSLATMNIGDVITMVASVNADAGLATTVTWTSSDATKASVGASTGVVTALAATPGVAICAASTVDAGKKGCGQVTVNNVGVQLPATVSISSITQTNLNTPVVPANVNGNIFVSLSVNPGNQTVKKVSLTVAGVVVDSQTFSATQSAALRGAADQALATQAVAPVIVFTINTAKYNATTGAPSYMNGNKTIGAMLYTAAGGSTPASTATYASNLVFNNVDGFAVTLTPATTVAAGVTDAQGYRWFGNGTLTISALPVMYSGLTVGSVTAALGANGGCGAVGTAGTATTMTSGAFAVSLALTGAQSATPACQTAPNMATITAVDANGNTMTLGGTNGVLNTQTGIRWDNVAPPTAGLVLNPNGRAGGWLNDAVAFNAVSTGATSNNWVAAAVTDAGVGGTITYSVRTGTTYTLAKAAAASTSAAALANSATATTYCAVAYAADALGNTTTSPAGTCGASATSATYPALPATGAASLTFGVDRIAPIVTVNSALALNTKSMRMFGGAGNSVPNIVWTLSDTSVNSASANITLLGRATRYGSAAADTVFISATVAAGTTTYSTAGSAVNGYWTVTMAGSDQAGNSVTVTPYTYLQDNAAATVSNALQTNAGLTAGGAESFFASVADGVDLDSAAVIYTLSDGASLYPFALGAGTVLQGSPFLAAAQVKTGSVTGAWPAYPRGLAATLASGSAISTVSGGAFAQSTAVTFWATDQTADTFGTLSGTTANAPGTLNYTAVNLPAAAAWAGLYTGSTVTLTSSATTAAATLYGTATATHLRLADTVKVVMALTGQATPPTAAPYGRTELWFRTGNGTAAGASVAGSKGYRLLTTGITPVATYDGQAQIATWTYTFVFTPGTAYNMTAGTAFYGFVGYDSNFNAIITPSVGTTVAP